MFCIPGGRGIKKKQPPIYHPLALTLHEIFFGGVKKMKIHRLAFVGEDQARTEVSLRSQYDFSIVETFVVGPRENFNHSHKAWNWVRCRNCIPGRGGSKSHSHTR